MIRGRVVSLFFIAKRCCMIRMGLMKEGGSYIYPESMKPTRASRAPIVRVANEIVADVADRFLKSPFTEGIKNLSPVKAFSHQTDHVEVRGINPESMRRTPASSVPSVQEANETAAQEAERVKRAGTFGKYATREAKMAAIFLRSGIQRE